MKQKTNLIIISSFIIALLGSYLSLSLFKLIIRDENFQFWLSFSLSFLILLVGFIIFIYIIKDRIISLDFTKIDDKLNKKFKIMLILGLILMVISTFLEYVILLMLLDLDYSHTPLDLSLLVSRWIGFILNVFGLSFVEFKNSEEKNEKD